MRKIAVIIALTAIAFGVAYGQRVEPPEGEAPAATPPAASETAPAGVVIGGQSDAGPPPAPPLAETPGGTPGMGAFGQLATGEQAGRTATTTQVSSPVFTMGGMELATGINVGNIARFTLRDPQTNATYGPFPLKPGMSLTIGDRRYILEVEQVAPLPMEVEKTEAQMVLEDKLRRRVVDTVAFEAAPLMEVVDFLSRYGDVNIVVTDVVLEIGLDITLRLRNIPMYDAIRYVAEVTGIGFRVDDHAVVLTDTAPVPIGRGGR